MTGAFRILLVLGLCAISPAGYSQTSGPQVRDNPPSVGRLFLTPNERRQLEINPDSTTSLDIDWDHIETGSSGKGGPGIIAVNGVVMRKSGKHTVWVNGQAGEYRGPYGARAPEIAMPLTGDNGNEVITIKPGQVLNPRFGTKGDPFTPPPPQ